LIFVSESSVTATIAIEGLLLCVLSAAGSGLEGELLRAKRTKSGGRGRVCSVPVVAVAAVEATDTVRVEAMEEVVERMELGREEEEDAREVVVVLVGVVLLVVVVVVVVVRREAVRRGGRKWTVVVGEVDINGEIGFEMMASSCSRTGGRGLRGLMGEGGGGGELLRRLLVVVVVVVCDVDPFVLLLVLVLFEVDL
jgi:hypothetical protein